MLYGPDEGDGRLREALAKWLSDFYIPEQPVESERITITGGASQNLGVVAQTFTDPVYTRNVWIVSPTYMLVFRILDDAGLHHKLRAVPEDEQGIDVEYLRREIEKSERQAQIDGNNQPVSSALCIQSSQHSVLKRTTEIPFLLFAPLNIFLVLSVIIFGFLLTNVLTILFN